MTTPSTPVRNDTRADGQDNLGAERSFAAIAQRLVAGLTTPLHVEAGQRPAGALVALKDAAAREADADDEPASRKTPLEWFIAATRLALTLEAAPAALTTIENGQPIVVIETGDPDMNEPLCAVLRRALPGGRCVIEAPDALCWSAKPFVDVRTLVLFEGAAATKVNETLERNRHVGAAILSGAVVLGVATNAARELPRDLVRAADHRLTLAPLDAAGIGFVIEAFTEARPTKPVAARVAREATLSDLRLALRGGNVGDVVVERLVEAVGARLATADRAPRLENLEGYGEAKTIGLEIAAQLADYGLGKIPWSAVSRGLVLDGPPGTGKTSFAKALAKTSGLPLVAGSLARWQGAREGHLGHLLGAMQATFAEAIRKAPSLLLVDELDAFGSRDNFHAHPHRDYAIQVVNGLLECLDGVDGREGVVVIGTTNHVARIDPAIIRAGRFDRVVRISLPDVDALAKILRHFLGSDLGGVDLRPAAIAARGGSGADCEAWVKRAREIARRSGAPMTPSSLIAVIRDGRSELPPLVRRRVAVHEAGHATAAVAFDLGEPKTLNVHATGGVAEVAFEPTALTADDLLREIAHLLAGREAERLVLGNVSAGAGGDASSDLGRATLLAAGLVGSFGLGSLGALWLGAPRDLMASLPLTSLNREVRLILRHAGEEARRALIANRSSLERLAQALFDVSFLDADQIQDALGAVLKIAVRPVESQVASNVSKAESAAQQAEVGAEPLKD